MKDLTEQIYDELNAQVVRMLNHSLNQASRIVELETQLKDHSAQAFSIGETYANALSRIAELEAQLAAAQAPVREVPGWIACADQLPEIGQEVIVFTPRKGRKVTALSRFIHYEEATNFHWDNSYPGKGNLHLQESVTHWMPLPASPVQQEGA